MNSAKYLGLLLLLFPAHFSFAQNYVLANDIPVTHGSHTLTAAWAGGLTAPQLSAVDLDNDGILDLAVFERDGDWILPFQNGGITGQIEYSFRPELIPQFPSGLVDWALFRDFDGDGYIDIFTAVAQVSNVRVYRNTSTFTGGSLSFALYKDTVYTNYPPYLYMYSAKSDLPAIDDIDGDGDLDLLTFQLGGTKVEWHKNLSKETTGGLLGMEFVRQSRCFGHFEEDQFGCDALIGRVPCGAGEKSEQPDFSGEKIALHSGSTILSLDLDNNGLKDLVIGDVGCPTLYGLHNGGTAQIADFTVYEPGYPSNDSAAYVLLFPAAYHLDVNNDGINDLLVAPNKTDNVEDQQSIQYFKNEGTQALPEFVFQRYGILQDEMIDMGSESMPLFLDYNGDGRQDLMVGGAGRYDSLVGFIPKLTLYENTGTAQQPAFQLVSADYMNLRNHPAFANATHLRPAAADLDADGDQDLLLGNVDGAIFHFNNTAGSGNPANFNLVTANFAAIDEGFNSSPQLIDLDADGDKDMLVGNHRGYVKYYKNTGSPSVPNFVLESDTFGYVKVNNFSGLSNSNGYSNPFACDYDADGDLDLLVGCVGGEVQVFEDISLVPGATFAAVGNLFGRDFGVASCPAATVLDSARLSYVVGDHRGGLMLLRDSGPVAVAQPQLGEVPNIRIFPNPADESATLDLGADARGIAAYVVYDLLGHERQRGEINGQQAKLDLASFENGLYLVVLRGKKGQWSKKFIVAH